MVGEKSSLERGLQWLTAKALFITIIHNYMSFVFYYIYIIIIIILNLIFMLVLIHSFWMILIGFQQLLSSKIKILCFVFF